MRVLQIFGQMNCGGAEMRTLELMPVLAARGVRFDFCTLNRGGQPGHLDKRIREMGGEVVLCPLGHNRLNFARRFKTLLRDGRYDVVHSHVHLTSGWILKLASAAGVHGRVMHFRNTTDGARSTLMRQVYSKLMRCYADQHANQVLAVCEAAMVHGWGPGWAEDPRMKVIYNGLDIKRFKEALGDRVSLLSDLGLPADSKLVIQVGRFTPAKGHRELVPVLPALIADRPNVHVLFVGDGVRRSEIEGRVKELGLDRNVHFLGVRSDIPQLLKSCDLSILPSLWEGLPGVVLESLAAGLRVVATPLPGVREIAAHSGRVEIVESGEMSELVQQIGVVLDKDELGVPERFPAAFDLERCAAQWLEVYGRITSRD